MFPNIKNRYLESLHMCRNTGRKAIPPRLCLGKSFLEVKTQSPTPGLWCQCSLAENYFKQTQHKQVISCQHLTCQEAVRGHISGITGFQTELTVAQVSNDSLRTVSCPFLILMLKQSWPPIQCTQSTSD